MDKQEFIDYIHENFNISVEAMSLIANILDYASRFTDEEEQYEVLCALLDGTIGLSDDEIRKICL